MTTTSSLLRPLSNHPHTSKVDNESDMASSMRVSVLSRSLPMRQTSTGTSTSTAHTNASSFRDRERENGGLSSSASSMKSVIRSSSDSFASAMSSSTIGARGGMSPARMIVKETKAKAMKDRPDSKLTPSVLSSPSILEPEVLEEEEDRMEEEEEEGERGGEGGGGEYDDNGDEEQQLTPTTPQQTSVKKVLITRTSLASVASRSTISSLTGTGSTSSVSGRTLSSASSARSQSTAGKSPSVASSRLNVHTPSTPKSTTIISPRSSSSRPQRNAAISRPTSSLSTTTDSTYRTASPGGVGGGGGGLHTPTRARRTSATSTISIRTTPSRGGDKRSSPVGGDRTRRISGASVSSVASNAGSVKTTGGRVRTISTGKKSVGGGGVTPPPPLPDPKKLSPASVPPRPGSIHSSISGGSTVSNSTSKRVVRKTVLKKKKSGEVGTPATEVPVKEVEMKEGTEKDTVGDKDKDNKEMDVDMKVDEVEKEVVVQEANDDDGDDDGNSLPPIADDIIVEDPPLLLRNASSSMSIKPTSEDPVTGTTESGINEHKKSSSSASTSSVATLKRKGSADTIKTVTTSSPAIVVVDVPLIKQLPPTPSSPHIPSSPPLPQQKQQLPQPPPPPPPPVLQHQSSTLKPPASFVVDPKAVPQGATLDIGIPCIISSKRKRFKAYARYIGEVQGESGAWVGVEVPMPFGDSWTTSSGGFGSGGDAGSVAGDVSNKAFGERDDRQWNDGTWGGMRYFEIGGMGGSEWDYGSANEDRSSRRRRVDGVGGGGGGGGGGGVGRGDKGILKREGDQLSISSASEMRRKKLRSVSPSVSDMSGVETRGLFVRPQQVLYVVDAVGADL